MFNFLLSFFRRLIFVVLLKMHISAWGIITLMTAAQAIQVARM